MGFHHRSVVFFFSLFFSFLFLLHPNSPDLAQHFVFTSDAEVLCLSVCLSLPPPPVFGSDFKIIIYFIITVVVNVFTIVLCVDYWHAD